MSDIDLKLCDLLEFSKMCAPEYNTPELSDRVLVFDVMQDGWEPSSQSAIKSGETTDSTGTGNALSEKQHLERPEEPESEENKEETRYEVVALKVETEGDSGSHSENERDDPQKLACKQDSKTNDVLTLTTSFDDLTESVAPTVENLNEPLRQHKIYVHSFWLSVQSPYFRSLFYSSGMKENHDKEVHVKVSMSEENAHLILLEAMYCGDVLNDKTVDELLAVLELADKYDLKFVFKKCKYVMQKNASSFETSTQIMHVIKVKHNMDDVEDLAATLQLVLAKEFSPLDESWQSEKFTNLSEPSVKYLLSSDDLIVQSENTVFHALMYWMEQNEIDPASLEEKNDLLAAVRFKLVTIDYLYNVIKNHPIASTMPGFDELYLGGMTYHAIPSEQKKRLKEQPVLRKKPEENIIQFTFAVKEQEFETVRRQGSELHSEEFWACGYKMSVSLTREQRQNRRGYDTYVYPHLNVHHLNEESFVPLKYAVTGISSFSFNIGLVPNFGSTGLTASISWQEESFVLDSSSKKYHHMTVNNDTRVLNIIAAPF